MLDFPFHIEKTKEFHSFSLKTYMSRAFHFCFLTVSHEISLLLFTFMSCSFINLVAGVCSHSDWSGEPSGLIESFQIPPSMRPPNALPSLNTAKLQIQDGKQLRVSC